MAYTKEGVKWFSSAMQGAPSLTGTAGSLIAVLDACLKDGFGLLSVDSIVVASGVGTMTIGAGHLYKQWSVLAFAGVTGAMTGLNAQFKLKTATATQVTFDCPGVPDGTASGTITAKIAPLGWLKPFSGTNQAAYKSNDSNANGHFLSIDDTTTTTSPRALAYENMTAVMTGTKPFPTSGTGVCWPKANSGAARRWLLVGDELLIFFHSAHGSNDNGGCGVLFGDPIEEPGAVDPYNTLLIGPGGEVTGTSGPIGFGDLAAMNNSTDGANAAWVARAYHGLGGGFIDGLGSFAGVGGSVNSGSVNMYQYFPNPLNNHVSVSKMRFWDPLVVRGVVPGIYYIMNRVASVPYAYTQHQVLPPGTFTDDLATKAMLVLGSGANTSAGADAPARVLIDIVGPWR